MNTYGYEQWEPVIGLEVHVQLNTKSKLFSTAPNQFGGEPNTLITEVCTGQPGALPILNQEAVRKAVLFGLSIGSEIPPSSQFERKSYFYPDSPRNFQITQYEHPILVGGKILTEVDGEEKEFLLHHAHLEDDAGMLKHFPHFAGVDYNRAGVPLLEIVTLPVMHSAKEAVACVMAIRAIMEYIDASDCNMEEGSLRVDANVSVRLRGETHLRNKTEIKNMNSFSLMEMAIHSEIQRQIRLYTKHPHEAFSTVITSGTYRWDSQKKETTLMRRKETADDYRYFPEPDLPPLLLDTTYIESVKKTLPELPRDRFSRYVSTLGLTPYSASVLVNDKKLCDYFEKGLPFTSNPQALCNWISVEFAGRVKEKNTTLWALKLPPENIATLVRLIDQKTITGKMAKMIADEMVEHPERTCEEMIENNPEYKPITSSADIEPLVDQVIRDNPQSVMDFHAGKAKAMGFLVGQVMKLTQGKSSPAIVNELLRKKLENR